MNPIAHLFICGDLSVRLTGGKICVPALTQKLGVCIICGRRVFDEQNYVEAVEGYCHTNCISGVAVTS